MFLVSSQVYQCSFLLQPSQRSGYSRQVYCLAWSFLTHILFVSYIAYIKQPYCLCNTTDLTDFGFWILSRSFMKCIVIVILLVIVLHMLEFTSFFDPASSPRYIYRIWLLLYCQYHTMSVLFALFDNPTAFHCLVVLDYIEMFLAQMSNGGGFTYQNGNILALIQCYHLLLAMFQEQLMKTDKLQNVISFYQCVDWMNFISSSAFYFWQSKMSGVSSS